jgi:hypothetical protein
MNKDEMFIIRPVYTQLTLREQLARLTYAWLDDQLVVVKELVDNACDEAEKRGGPVAISLTDDALFSVTNRGRVTADQIDKILDLSVLLSAKYNHYSYTRGRIGLGLKYAVMLSYQQDDDNEFVIESDGAAHTIRLADRQALDPKQVLNVSRKPIANGRTVRVGVKLRDAPKIRYYVLSYIALNPHIAFSFNGVAYGQTAELEKQTDVDISSYSKEEFLAFVNDHKKFAPDFTYEKLVRLFNVDKDVKIDGSSPEEVYDFLKAHAGRISPPIVGQKAVARRLKQLGFKLLRYGQNSYPDGSAAEIAVLERSMDLSVPFLSHNMIVGINGSSIPALSIRFSRDGLVGLKLPKDRSLYLAYYSTTPRFEGQNKEQLRVNDALKADIEELLKEKRPRENADWLLNLPSHDIHLPEPYSKGLRMRKKTYLLLNECARIIEGLIKEVGLITVRQLYYRLVVELIIANLPEAYDNFDHHLVRGRELGLISYDAFTDRSRGEHLPHVLSLNESPKRYLQNLIRHSFSVPDNPDRWHNQPCHVELWIEKDALVPFFGQVAKEKQVILFPCRGFSSVTKLNDAMVRFQKAVAKGKKGVRIVYAGDLDPSGWGIYENIVKKLDIMNKTGLDITVDRFALQEDQVSGLHHIPVKKTDSRLKAFMEKFPDLPGAYELDAVPPLQLMEMARAAVEKYFDTDLDKERAEEVQAWQDEYRLLVEDVFARLGLDPKEAKS